MNNFFPAREIKLPSFSSFVSFDTETTGLYGDSEIIEIGAVKVEDGHVVDSFSQFVKPFGRISAEITQITGISNDMVKSAPHINEVLPQFKDFAGDSILVGHNAICFDCKIMGNLAGKCGIVIPNDVFDTLRFARYRCEPFPGLESRRLSVMCDYFNIHSDVFHRASDDALVTAKLYFRLKKYGIIKEGDKS